jgi:hypothetical protein
MIPFVFSAPNVSGIPRTGHVAGIAQSSTVRLKGMPFRLAVFRKLFSIACEGLDLLRAACCLAHLSFTSGLLWFSLDAFEVQDLHSLAFPFFLLPLRNSDSSFVPLHLLHICVAMTAPFQTGISEKTPIIRGASQRYEC